MVNNKEIEDFIAKSKIYKSNLENANFESLDSVRDNILKGLKEAKVAGSDTIAKLNEQMKEVIEKSNGLSLKNEGTTLLKAKLNELNNEHKTQLNIQLANLLKNNKAKLNESPELRKHLNTALNSAKMYSSEKEFEEQIATALSASDLHESWRDGRYNQETQSYEPRWKTISKNTPVSDQAVVKVNKNGERELDIANTPFEHLTKEWQMENYKAAQVAVKLAMSENGYSLEEAGSIIHDEWLKRNEWAKGSSLDVSFESLPYDEQVKDTNQFVIAKQKLQEFAGLIKREQNQQQELEGEDELELEDENILSM